MAKKQSLNKEVQRFLAWYLLSNSSMKTKVNLPFWITLTLLAIFYTIWTTSLQTIFYQTITPGYFYNQGVKEIVFLDQPFRKIFTQIESK